MLRSIPMAIAVVMLSGGMDGGAGEAAQVQSLVVDMEKVIQPDFLGINAVYHGFAFMPEQVKEGMDDADRAREFGRVAAMKLNIARTWYRPDWACGAKLSNPFDGEAPKMKAFCSWLAAMKERNVDVALQAGWWFPGDTYYGNGGPGAEDPARYARWVSESVHQLVTVRGYSNIKYLVLFTEPTTTSSGHLPKNETLWDYYAKVVKAIHGQLVADGRRKLVKLIGPNNTQRGAHLPNAAKDLQAELDIFSGHDYSLGGYNGWLELCGKMQAIAASAGKELWLDEYGKQDEPYRRSADYGNYVAQAVAASINAGNQTSTIWLLFDQQYVSTDTSNVNEWTSGDSFYKGVHRWGTCRWPRDSIENPTWPYPHWYAFGLMSRYLGGRNGTRVYQTTGTAQVPLCAVRHPDGHWSFLAVNCGKTVPLRVAFSKPLERPLHRYVYNPARVRLSEAAELSGYSRVFEKPGSGFEDSLPQMAVVLYSTIAGAKAPEEIEPKLRAGIKEARCSSFDDPQSAALCAFDGDPRTAWNAGGFPPAWVEAVFEKSQAVAEIGAAVSQQPAGETQHEVVATFMDGSQKVVHVFQGPTKGGDVLQAKFDPPLRDVVAIRVVSKKSPSWVSWAEITVK